MAKPHYVWFRLCIASRVKQIPKLLKPILRPFARFSDKIDTIGLDLANPKAKTKSPADIFPVFGSMVMRA